MKDFTLTLKSMDQPGVTAAVTSRIAEHGGNITEAQQFNDPETGQFFMRVAFTAPNDAAALSGALKGEARRFGLDWTLEDASRINPPYSSKSAGKVACA